MAKEQTHLTVVDLMFIAVSAIPSAAIIQYGPTTGFWAKVGAITGGIVLFHFILWVTTQWLARKRPKRR